MPVAPTYVKKNFETRGAVAKVFECKDEEILIHGPAGTGKSRGILEKLHLVLLKYPGARGLLCRKTRSSLTNTGIVTYEKEVLVPADNVRFHTPTQAYRYATNKSELIVGGLDDSQKIMSSQYDIIVVLEATELLPDDWQDLKTRLRNPVMPYHQIIADCNPAPPSHWLWRSVLNNQITAFASKHEDNPYLYNAKLQQWTEPGRKYKKILDSLTGVRYKRLTLGLWVASEGVVFDIWDPDIHVVDRKEIPASWPRYWSVDWGYTNPFVWQAFAEDPDGRLWKYREIYHTQRTVQHHCRIIKSLDEPRPRAIVCDHDAEDRATFEAEMGLKTLPASKGVSIGIQAVTERLKVAGDGLPRIMFMRDSLVEIDRNLETKKLPIKTEDEFESYVWDESTEKKKEQPLKKDDHGMDNTRYVVMHVDATRFSKPGISAL